jgi:RNA polymerase sigma-70 factor (ECF subfamily)
MTDALDQLYERMQIARCQAGDAEAFAEIVGRYHARLHYFLRKMFGDAGRVDDLLQDVWLDVFRSLAKLRDPGAFAAWVYRIARDRASRDLRQSKRILPIDDQPEPAEADEDANDSFTEEDARLVHECLDELTREHREVLVLRFMEAMDYEQISAVVGSGVGTVRSRLHYAKRALRTAIEKRGQR